MKKIGLIINPIAGMGGRAGLKGTDGADILQKAIELGSTPEAPIKAEKALKQLVPLKDQFVLKLASGVMGEEAAKNLGLNYDVVYEPSYQEGHTSAEDTRQLIEAIKDEDVDLIIFVGGDGTARDVYNAIGTTIPAIGVPGGVKIYSAVYGNSPESAGKLAYEWLSGEPLSFQEEEVLDLDEDGFRRDDVDIQVYGYLTVPYHAQYLQNLKAPSPQSDADAQTSIALNVIDQMEDDAIYIIGSGTSTRHILDELGLPVTVLGVDVIQNRQLLVKDANEQEILKAIEGHDNVHLIVTPMGGQGYLLGRGNQQLSSRVLRHVPKENITIVATPGKMMTIGSNPLLVYTMDDEVDEKLTGYYKVTIGYGQYSMHKVTAIK